jgi:hypothetical protein
MKPLSWISNNSFGLLAEYDYCYYRNTKFTNTIKASGFDTLTISRSLCLDILFFIILPKKKVWFKFSARSTFNDSHTCSARMLRLLLRGDFANKKCRNNIFVKKKYSYFFLSKKQVAKWAKKLFYLVLLFLFFVYG